VSGGSTGTNVRRRRLNPSDFLQREMPLPSMAEQRRVSTRIDELSTQINEARSLRQQAAKDAEVLYPQIRDRLFRELKRERKQVGEIFDLINGRAFKPEEWQEQGRKIVRIQNLKHSNAAYNRFSGQVDPKHLIHAGDVLFAWSGQVVSLGAHIWRDEEAILNQHIFNVRGGSDFLPEFVKEGFNALVDEMKEQVRGLEMFHIRKQEVVRLLFPVPKLPEQRRIVAELDALQAEVDALKRLQAETAAELDALLPALLDRAFHGELCRQ
jgi:type I restriction enzyme S subunit